MTINIEKELMKFCLRRQTNILDSSSQYIRLKQLLFVRYKAGYHERSDKRNESKQKRLNQA